MLIWADERTRRLQCTFGNSIAQCDDNLQPEGKGFESSNMARFASKPLADTILQSAMGVLSTFWWNGAGVVLYYGSSNADSRCSSRAVKAEKICEGHPMLAATEVESLGKLPQSVVCMSPKDVASATDAILRSTRFKNSLQLQNLLHYVTMESLEGNEDALKERVIGVYVFGRRPDYDTTNDPIVRSRMGLLRRRLAQYYEGEGAHAAIRISIPIGTYRPTFEVRQDGASSEISAPVARPLSQARSAQAPPVIPGESQSGVNPERAIDVNSAVVGRSRLPAVIALVAAIGLIVASSLWWLQRSSPSELDMVWGPLIKNGRPVYIYAGTMPVFDPESPSNEASSPDDFPSPVRLPEPPSSIAPQVGPDHVYLYGEGMLNGSVYAIARISVLLNRYSRISRLRLGSDLPFSDLKGSPLVLIGSFDNYWTRVLNEELPFYFDRGYGIRERGGRNYWHNPLRAEMTQRMMEDYAIVFRVMDSKAGAPVLGIAGLSTCGTHAAADFVSDPMHKRTLSDIPRNALENKNIELVLHISLVNCAPASVHVIASKVW